MPPPSDPGKKETDQLRGRILDLIGGGRRTPADILKTLVPPLSRGAVQSALRDLVADGELAYTHEHGRTFLEPSFDRAVRVARRIVLAPPGRTVSPQPGDVVIRIRPGASFGGGRHPTTRLALRAIEEVLSRTDIAAAAAGGRVLDIGTGTGVLAIAAVLLGLGGGVGLDIDPCAVAEARENVRLNGLEGKIEITDRPLALVDRPFLLIAANLRLPTLAGLAQRLETLTAEGGGVVLSGIRVEECDELLSAYSRSFECVWRAEEFEWAGIALKRR
ncbi:MAG: methyltransferase domain-containing protein [Desulfobacteraceae bacterium]|nr:MAG: methyltransferase domain-containing protein [Desulfobacteraceae bacterium]